MIREIDPQRLLRHADELARGGGRGQPRNIDLRRATSAAYYAVFHRVALYTLERLVPTAPRSHQLGLARSLQHGSVAQVCRAVLHAPAPKTSAHHRPVTDDLAADVRITDFAQVFLDLQQRRHEADYDHLADFNRPGALSSVQGARQAVEWLGQISNSNRGRTLFLLIAMQSGLGR
ncbi:hypothetical protein GCM10023200_55170 [Actinomycetospora chlora]|uniref:HEPN domain-containing protein n=1 Tax=Actinomycetospora chlora TaxID=663608 RepID=A0ABP9CL40_9PSEU